MSANNLPVADEESFGGKQKENRSERTRRQGDGKNLFIPAFGHIEAEDFSRVAGRAYLRW
jgi:hypothetical protein